jgi:putative ABC transport system permease protein
MHFVTFIVKNLTRRPVRSGLTVLGLAATVASVIALLGISHNIRRAVESSFEQRRIDLQVMQAGKSTGLNSDFGEYLVEEARKLPDVEAVAEGVANLIDVTRESGSSDQVLLQGWRPDNFGFEEMRFTAGRKLQSGDHRKVVLGTILAGNLKKGVGDTVVFGRDDPDNPDNRYEVVGVFKSPYVFEDGGAIVLLEDGRKMTGMRISGFSVRVRAGPDHDARVEQVRRQIEALRDPDDPSVRLSAQSPAEFVRSLSHLKLIRAISWMVSVIAVLIGVISMLNTMVMSVLERTQEIGILRAVGWPRGRIVRMVLAESVALGLAAAAAGTVVAVGGTYLLTLSPKVNGFIDPGLAPAVIAQGVGMTALIGLLGGAYPAYRAARLLPTEAIRHD